MSKITSKVVKLFPDKEAEDTCNPQVLEGVINQIKSGEIVRYTIIAELRDGEVATGYANCNFTDRQILASTMQTDININLMMSILQGQVL